MANFSTLKRASASAMMQQALPPQQESEFQYPQTGLCLCNLRKGGKRGACLLSFVAKEGGFFGSERVAFGCDCVCSIHERGHFRKSDFVPKRGRFANGFTCFEKYLNRNTVLFLGNLAVFRGLFTILISICENTSFFAIFCSFSPFDDFFLCRTRNNDASIEHDGIAKLEDCEYRRNYVLFLRIAYFTRNL